MNDDAAFFRTLTTREIRRRQDLCSAQIARAFEQRNDTALHNLRRMETALTAEMTRRVVLSPFTRRALASDLPVKEL